MESLTFGCVPLSTGGPVEMCDDAPEQEMEWAYYEEYVPKPRPRHRINYEAEKAELWERFDERRHKPKPKRRVPPPQF